MSWIEDLIPAALNGVPFGLIDASKSGGRRTQTHEFADVDVAYVEDSGQAPTRHQVRAFVVGDDYHVVLQRLEEELEKGGDLEFDHPHRGKIFGLRLEGEYSTNEGRDQLGYAEVSFTLVQNGLPAPMIFESRPGAVKLAAARVQLAAQAELVNRSSGLDFLKSITRALARANMAMRKSYGRLLTQLGTVSALRNQIDQFGDAIDTLAGAPGTIATTFRGIGLSFMGVISSLSNVLSRDAKGYANPAGAMVDTMDDFRSSNSTADALADYAVATAVNPGDELAGDALKAKVDLDAYNVFVSATIVAAVAEFATEIDLPTADAADEFADAIVAVIDEILGATIGDGPISETLYQEMIIFKAKVIAFLTAMSDSLPQVEIVTVKGEASAILLAFWQGGVGGQALGKAVDGILAANTIENPLNLGDGAEIKVVSA